MVTFDVTCEVCGKKAKVYRSPSQHKPRFCSPQCYHKAQSLGFTHKHTEHRKVCHFCGKEFVIRNRRKLNKPYKYCSKECYTKAQKTGRVKRNRSKKRRIERLKEEGVCEICGWDRFIEITHIVPRSKGGTYDEFNVMFLCPNHHRLYENDLLNKNELSIIKDRIEKARSYFSHEVGK
jgi:hypothetical protein